MTGAPPPKHNRPPLKADLARSERYLEVSPRKNHQAPPLQTHLTTAPDPKPPSSDASEERETTTEGISVRQRAEKGGETEKGKRHKRLRGRQPVTTVTDSPESATG